MKLKAIFRSIFSFKSFKIVSICLVIMAFWSNFSVYYESKNFLFSKAKNLPSTKTALLLGTNKKLRNGNDNLYFKYRIDACLELFRSGKVSHILISGDNGSKEYNEPQDMKNELISRGIPEEKITLDYAGFDTYDSVLRAKMIFGQDAFIVVSQKFHNQRAVYIARRNGINAYGYNALDVKKMNGLKTKIREFFACVKAYIEVKVNVNPTYLGEKVLIK
ncbi:MAG: YdcF family protein [Crocinitomicaceae bacterium]|jgi:SanA protein|nr:YdcF family protein [Crocinitomicaceae bacterium]MDP4865572.1 YdcF family protein [Crocinitomicaceae bacterium]MDP5011005.1 YdcF family protein [Crocinitomicaceae bacterium]MDP5098987.1 YdcF family protein [Crocinitomicaceae bacterium]